MTTTLGNTQSSLSATLGARTYWYLTIVHHPDARARGRRAVLTAGGSLEVARDGDAFGAGALADPKLSRRHCRFEVSPTGTLKLSDHASRNGTLCNGERVAERVLAARDVVRFGSALCVVSAADRPLAPDAGEPLGTASPALQTLLETLAGLARTDRFVVLRGEEDTGAQDVADLLDRQAGGAGRAHVADLDLASDEDLAQDVAALARQSVLFRALPLADEARRDALVAALSRAPASPHRGVFFWRRDGAQDARDALGAEFRRRLTPVVLELPPLRERQEDIASLAERFSQRHHGAPARLDTALATALLRAPWLGNLRELEQFARIFLRPADGGAALSLRDEHLASLGLLADGSTPAPLGALPTAPVTPGGETPAYRIASDGRSFQLPDGTPVDLTSRYAIARVLRALVEQYQRKPQAHCSVESLVSAGWPGVRLVADTGPNRLYVAINTLRKLGLRDVLERGEDGYRLVAGPRVLVVAPARPV